MGMIEKSDGFSLFFFAFEWVGEKSGGMRGCVFGAYLGWPVEECFS